jgi:hypothetical protein
MVLVPLTFLFVLLIILIAKAPKVGAWVVGGLVLLAPIVLLRSAHAGMLSRGEAVPLFVVPLSFLFVLLIILLAKAPRAGGVLIVAIVIMVMVGLFFVPIMSRRASYAPTGDVIHSQWQEIVTEHGVDRVQVWEHNPPASGVTRVTQARPAPPAPPSPPAPIWSEGVEQEFEADVYPSSLAAAKALGRRMAKPIRTVAGDPNGGIKVILFQEGNDRGLVSALGRAIGNELPGVHYTIEADLRNIQVGEVALTLRREESTQEQRRRNESPDWAVLEMVKGGRIVGTAFTAERRASAEAHFIEKPWVESFGTFASERPDQPLIIARSTGTSTSESEANQQALDDARARLTEALGRQEGHRFAEMAQPAISTTDVLNGGFIADRFVQSFDTSTGKVWRQAFLIDVSGPKLAELARVKMHQGREVRMSWARMGFSVIGVLVLIGGIYFFLNMATRGYYEWSLRIAGVILAIVAIVSVLMIVQ